MMVETRGVMLAMTLSRKWDEQHRASPTGANTSTPRNAKASNGRRLNSTRWMCGNTANRAKWSPSVAVIVGRTVMMEQWTPWLERAAMKWKKETWSDIVALGMYTHILHLLAIKSRWAQQHLHLDISK